jgi:hypothetical protein
MAESRTLSSTRVAPLHSFVTTEKSLQARADGDMDASCWLTGLGSFGTELTNSEWEQIHEFFDHEGEGYVCPLAYIRLTPPRTHARAHPAILRSLATISNGWGPYIVATRQPESLMHAVHTTASTEVCLSFGMVRASSRRLTIRSLSTQSSITSSSATRWVAFDVLPAIGGGVGYHHGFDLPCGFDCAGGSQQAREREGREGARADCHNRP